MPEGLEVAVLPRSLAHERRQHLAQRAAKERVYVLLQRVALLDAWGCRRRIQVAKAVLLVANVALLLETTEHDADRGIGRRIRQPCMNLAGRCTVSQGKDRVHDLALTAREAAGTGCRHRYVSFWAMCDVCLMSNVP